MRKPLLPALLAALLLAAPLRAQQDTNPVLLEAVAPTYPRSHFSNPSRTVLVGLTVNPEGTPESVHVVKGAGQRFDRNAVETVSQYKFKPATRAGKPIPMDIQVEVNYKAK